MPADCGGVLSRRGGPGDLSGNPSRRAGAAASTAPDPLVRGWWLQALITVYGPWTTAPDVVGERHRRWAVELVKAARRELTEAARSADRRMDGTWRPAVEAETAAMRTARRNRDDDGQ